MKARKIVALLLSVLMLLGAVPMAFVTASADTTAATAPATLPDGKGYYNLQISDGFVVSASKSTANIWWADSKTTTVADKTTWAGSKGMMFKFDGTGVAGTDPFNVAIELAIYSENGNTYLLSDPNLAKAHGGKAADTANTSSTWYISTDGKNWTTVTQNWVESYAVTAPITAERTSGYVYIPLDQFWSKGLSTDANKTMQNGADTLAAMQAGGKTVTLGDVKVRAEKGANDVAFSMSEIGFVFTASEIPTSAPAMLPDGQTYKNTEFLVDSYDLLAAYQAKKGVAGATDVQNMGWISASLIGEQANSTLRLGADGIMFKIDATQATANSATLELVIVLQVAYKQGGKDKSTYVVATPQMAANYGAVTCPDDATSTWYYSTNGLTWNETTVGKGASRNSIPVGKGVAYVYIPMDAFWTKQGETFLSTGTDAATKEPAVPWSTAKTYFGNEFEIKMTNYYFGGNFTDQKSLAQDPAVKISEWRVVTQGDLGAAPGAASAPTTLPTTGTTYTGEIIDPEFTIIGNENGGTGGNSWSGQWYGSKFNLKNVDADWMHSEGFMFKFDTSKVAPGTDILTMLVEFSVTSGKGSTYLLSDPNMVAAYGANANGQPRRLPASVLQTATSTWYYTTDGVTWQSSTRTIQSGSPTGIEITSDRTTGYIFIPLDQFWSYGISGDPNGMTAFDALNILGNEAKVGDMKIRLATNNVSSSANTVLSEFRFVKSTSYIFDESVSLTENMAWNLFVSVPDGYTNASMTFQMGSKTLTPKAEELAGNVVKYTFPNIGFADAATEITATWTAKDGDGKTVTQTYTNTMANYLRKICDENDALVCRELVISILHYCAALQKLNGYSGTLCDDGIQASEVPQDSSKIRHEQYINPNEEIWQEVSLAMIDGALYIKVKVTPPDPQFTHVRYQTAGRLSTTEIVDGYAYVPVYAYEARDTIAMNYYKRGMASSDYTMGVNLYYVLKQKISAGVTADEKAVYDTYMTYVNEARVYKR